MRITDQVYVLIFLLCLFNFTTSHVRQYHQNPTQIGLFHTQQRQVKVDDPQLISSNSQNDSENQNSKIISDLFSLAVLIASFALLGILIVRRQVKRNLRIVFFLAGFILFFDELWMFDIPLGRILPDMSDFHIEGLHHWMLGLFLMVLIGMYTIFSTLNHQSEKKLNSKFTHEED